MIKGYKVVQEPPPIYALDQTRPSAREIAAAALAADTLARNWRYDGLAALAGRSRIREFVAMRIAIARVLRRREWTITLIGALLGRHHTTMIHALEWVDYPYVDGVVELEGEFAGLMDEARPSPAWLAMADSIRARDRDLTRQARASSKNRPRARSVSLRPAGYAAPSMLARRWGVTAGKVRYLIAQGVLTALQTSDGRLWLPDGAKRPEKIA